MGKRDRKIR